MGTYLAPLAFGGPDPHFGGQVPPTENFPHGTVTFFASFDFLLSPLVTRDNDPLSPEGVYKNLAR